MNIEKETTSLKKLVSENKDQMKQYLSEISTLKDQV